MGLRLPSHIRDYPLSGDVIEITERRADEATDEQFDAEIMLRVVAVNEERVWCKEYGKGHSLITLIAWKDRLDKSSRSKVIRGAD